MPNYKKKRKPNPLKIKKEGADASCLKLTRGEKLEMRLPESKRKIQESRVTKTKVSVISKEDREAKELMLERSLKLKEMLFIKKEEKTAKSKKPAKIICYSEYEECEKTLKNKREKKQIKPAKKLSEKKIERILAMKKWHEEIKETRSIAKKEAKKEKAMAKKERILQLQLKSKEINKAKEDKPETKQSMQKGAPRKMLRSIINGRKDGRKNRQKDRIMTLRTSGREFLETYKTKKGQEKNRYIYIQNPEVRKVVILDKTKDLPIFEKQKSEE